MNPPEILADVPCREGLYADHDLIFGLIDARDASPVEDHELWNDGIEEFLGALEDGEFA